MFCCKCQRDLSDCICPDLQERLEAIASAPNIHLATEYKEQLEKQAAKNKNEQTKQE